MWAVSIGGAILQNELVKHLPPEILTSLLGNGRADSSNINLAYSIIPIIHTLEEPLKHRVRMAFADSLDVIWKTMTGVVGMGLLVSFMMRDVPMHQYVDEKWDIAEGNIGGGSSGALNELKHLQGLSKTESPACAATV